VTPAVPRWIQLLTALIAAALGVGAALAYTVSAAPAARADVSAPTTHQAARTPHQAARPAAPPTRQPNRIPTFPVPQPSRTAGPVPTAPAPAPVPTDPVPVDPVPTDVSGSAAQTGLFDPLNGKVHGATIFSYDFMGDDGSAWNVSAKASYAVGNWAWQGSTLVVGFAEWLMDWTLQFKLADAVVGPVNRVAVSYKTQIVDPLGVKTLFLTVAVVICGLRLWRGRHSNAAGEYLITMLISVLGATALAAPGTALLGEHGPFGISREIGTTAAAIALTDTDNSTDLSSPVVTVIGDTFIRRPHQLVNFGREFPDGSPCADVYQRIVEKGPWGTKDDPRDQMARCDKNAANFNGSETGLPLRATAALLTAVASALVAVFIVVVCAGLLLAQLSMAIAAVLGVFVVPLGVIPGFGRALLARWAGTVLAAAAAVVGAMAFFGLLMRVIQVVLSGDGGINVRLIGRFALIDLIVVGGLFGRHKLLSSIRRGSHRLAEQAHEMSANVGGGAARALPAGQLAGTVDPRAIAARVQTSGASAVRAGAAIGRGTTRTGEAAFTAGAAVGRVVSGRAGKPAGSGAAPGCTAAAGSVGAARPGAARTAGSWSKPRPASQLGTSVGVSREEIRGDRRKAAASQLASLAVNVGAMAATGGASTAAQAGAAAARAERVRRLVSATRAAEAARAYASRSASSSDTVTTRGRAAPPTAQQARPAPEPQAPGSGTGTARARESGRRRTAPKWVRVATAPALWVAGRPALPADPARAVKQPTPSPGDSSSPPSPSSRSGTPDRTTERAQPTGSATPVVSALRAPDRHAPAGPPASPPAAPGDEGDDGAGRPAPDSGTPQGGAGPDSAGTADGTSASRVRARLRRR